MSDVKVVRWLLSNNAPLNAVVPATRIMAGVLPQGIDVPAIAVSHLSTIRKNYVAETAVDWCTSRVQVTVMASNYVQLKATLKLVRDALPRSRGMVNGVAVDAVLSDIEGPDFTDEAGLWFGSSDHIVTFNE